MTPKTLIRWAGNNYGFTAPRKETTLGKGGTWQDSPDPWKSETAAYKPTWELEGLTHERFIVATEYIHWSKLLPTATLDKDTPALPCLQVFSISLALQPYSSHLLLPQFPEGQAAHIKPAAVTRTSLEKPLLPGKWPMKLCRHPKMLWKTERARHSPRGVLRRWRRKINTNMQSKDFGQTHHTAWKRSHCNSCHATCCLETYHNKVAVQSFSLKLIFEEQVFLCSFFFFFPPPTEVFRLDLGVWNHKAKNHHEWRKGWGRLL